MPNAMAKKRRPKKRAPRRRLRVTVDPLCHVCWEDIAGETTTAALEGGMDMSEIIVHVRSRARRGHKDRVHSFVHQYHLN